MAGPTGNSGGFGQKNPLDHRLDRPSDHDASSYRDMVRQIFFGQPDKETRAARELIARKLQTEPASSALGRSEAKSTELKRFEGLTESTDGPDRAAAVGQPASAIGSGADSPQPKTDGADIASVKLEQDADTDAELKRRAEVYGVTDLLKLAVKHAHKTDFERMLANFEALRQVFDVPAGDQAVRRVLREDLEAEALPKAVRCTTMHFYQLIVALRKQASLPALDVSRYANGIAERLSMIHFSDGKLVVRAEGENVQFDEAKHRLFESLGNRPNQTYSPCSLLICSPGEGGKQIVRFQAFMVEISGGRA